MLNSLVSIYGNGAGGGGATSFESIATVTVGAGGQATVSFTSIPSTYSHLQLRISAHTNSSATSDVIRMQFNSDTGSNYARHVVYGDGASAAAGGAGSTTVLSASGASGSVTNDFGVGVVDILDYANTNKYKTSRALMGVDVNGAGGEIDLYSGLWMNTAAISSIQLFPNGGTLISQYSTFALYGIKA